MLIQEHHQRMEKGILAVLVLVQAQLVPNHRLHKQVVWVLALALMDLMGCDGACQALNGLVKSLQVLKLSKTEVPFIAKPDGDSEDCVR